jgi:hypothetical protein
VTLMDGNGGDDGDRVSVVLAEERGGEEARVATVGSRKRACGADGRGSQRFGRGGRAEADASTRA